MEGRPGVGRRPVLFVPQSVSPSALCSSLFTLYAALPTFLSQHISRYCLLFIPHSLLFILHSSLLHLFTSSPLSQFTSSLLHFFASSLFSLFHFFGSSRFTPPGSQSERALRSARNRRPIQRQNENIGTNRLLQSRNMSRTARTSVSVTPDRP